MEKRVGKIERQTGETTIRVGLNLDGVGKHAITTGVGFFDHLLTALAKHSQIDIEVEAEGDLEVDAHHTVEDVGICLGRAFAQAVGNKVGITRFGFGRVPMDEALAEAAVDVSGRPFIVFRGEIPTARVGDFDTELAQEFFVAFAHNAAVTLHLQLLYGSNTHHCLEALFKAAARALGQGVALDPRVKGVPSTKDVL